METTLNLVVEHLTNYYFDGMGYELNDIPMCFDSDGVNDALDVIVGDMADENYDEDIFPIIATPRIRAMLDLKFICNELDNVAWDYFVSGLFDEGLY